MKASMIKWYAYRLAAMGPAEILLRASRWMGAARTRRAVQRETMPASITDVLAGSNATIGLMPVDIASVPLTDEYLGQITQRADEVCGNVVRLFGCEVALGEEINWYRDYVNGGEFPRVPAWEMSYRDPAGADIMPVWWLNRHQHLMPAAMGYFATGNHEYARAVLSRLQSWLEQCPYPLGPGWLTGIEAGVRLLTWCWLYRFLFARGRPPGCTDALLFAWFRSICQHVRFIDTHWSKYSSANNHIMAEAVGVLGAAATWPGLFPRTDYAAKCRRILTRECMKQVSPQGEYREQSTSYHAFVLELLVNACVFDEATQTALGGTVGRMAQVLHALACDVDAAPELGDADTAVATGILERSPHYYHEVVAAACGVAREPELRQFCTVGSPVFWYTGRNMVELPVPPADDVYGEGHVVWNGKIADDLQAKLCVDVGPLGLGSLAAHGHADALAVTLHIGGEPVLIDPGTFAYHRDAQWRTYFRSTRAHNTLRVDGRDQATMRGPFLWGARYRTTVAHQVLSDDQFDLAAAHDGYRRSCGVTHRRHLSWHPSRLTWTIEDVLVGTGSHEVELLFHVDPNRIVANSSTHIYQISGLRYTVTLKLPAALDTRLAYGETDPPLGWWSPVLGQKEPCSTIVAFGRVRAGDRLVTEATVAVIP